MTGISRAANIAIASKFPWDRYRTMVDAGTAQGDLAVQVVLAQPHMTGIGFDLAEVAPVFEDYVAEQGVSDRLTFRAGSFFDDPLIETPGGFDYTGADCMGWMREVGFSNTFVEHLVGPDSMVVGIK
jgi:hypothetical protein